jgi:hypothetical protein
MHPREAAIPDEKMLAEGKKMAQEILKVIHQKEPETKKTLELGDKSQMLLEYFWFQVLFDV